MTAIPPLPLPSQMLDADGRLVIDAPCVGCGYNLRTLLLAGLCPECGLPVAHSARGYFLQYCPPAWVRNLARGLLMVLVAIAGSFVLGILVTLPFIIPMITALQTAGGPVNIDTSGLRLASFVVNAVFTVVAIIGLRRLTAPQPGLDHRLFGARSQRVLRFFSLLLLLPVFLNLALGFFVGPLSTFTPGGPPPSLTSLFGGRPGIFIGASIAIGALSYIIYGVTVLALVRHLGSLMQRIPRPGLTRTAKVVFWGLLISVLLLSGGYAFAITTVYPAMSARMATLATMPSATSGPSGVAWKATYNFSTTSSPTSAATTPGLSSNQLAQLQTLGYMPATSSSPATAPASAPTTAAAMRAFATPGFFGGVMLGGCAAGLGGCTTLGFGITFIVLMIVACVALFESARAAEQNAALASPPTP